MVGRASAMWVGGWSEGVMTPLPNLDKNGLMIGGAR
jgi:hypothetical protein